MKFYSVASATIKEIPEVISTFTPGYILCKKKHVPDMMTLALSLGLKEVRIRLIEIPDENRDKLQNMLGIFYKYSEDIPGEWIQNEESYVMYLSN